jgi:hypothetical protein
MGEGLMEWWLLGAGLLTGFCGGWLFHPNEAEVTHEWLRRFNDLRDEELQKAPGGSRVVIRERALERLVAEMREACMGEW